MCFKYLNAPPSSIPALQPYAQTTVIGIIVSSVRLGSQLSVIFWNIHFSGRRGCRLKEENRFSSSTIKYLNVTQAKETSTNFATAIAGSAQLWM